MNVLILGSGGREHAFAWKIAKSSSCNNLFIAPGNAGTSKIASNLNVDVLNFDQVKSSILKLDINLVMVGPEIPLIEGIVDFINNDIDLKSVLVVGPSKAGAKLEGSKDFSKEFMVKHNIPTAKYQSFSSENLDSLSTFQINDGWTCKKREGWRYKPQT